MVVNATMFSAFEVQYGKSTSSKTSALRHLGHLWQITWFRACAETHTAFNTAAYIILAITFIYLHRKANKVAYWIDKPGLWISSMWVKFTLYAQVTWYGACAVARNAMSVKNVITDISRTHRRIVFELGGRVVTWQLWQLFQGQKVERQDHNVT